MATRSEHLQPAFDSITLQILDELQADGRLSFRELGDRVGLSAPAVTERVKRLERDGVITGYQANVDPRAVGYPMLAIIRIHSAGMNASRGGGLTGLIDELAEGLPEVVECHRVTGSESHVLRVRVRDVEHLQEISEKFWEYGDTITNLVTTTPVSHRAVPLDRR